MLIQHSQQPVELAAGRLVARLDLDGRAELTHGGISLEAPVWIVPCMEGANPTRTAGSSIYPAVQNMLLAARALGLGATLTTLYLNFEKEVEGALGLPSDVHSYALIPIGYPMGRFGPVRRVPLADVTYGDRWGQPYRDS